MQKTNDSKKALGNPLSNGVTDPQLALRRKALDRLRERLLDTSLRNKMLNYTDRGQKVVKIVNELPEVLFDLLVNKEKSMTLMPIPRSVRASKLGDVSPLPGNEKTNPSIFDLRGTVQPLTADLKKPINAMDELEVPARGQPRNSETRHLFDDKVQTPYSEDELDGRMRRIYNEYENIRESTGSNLLFLSIGFVEWFEPESKETAARYAPLILIPINLEKALIEVPAPTIGKRRGDETIDDKKRTVKVFRYNLKYSGEEIQGNATFRLKLRQSPFNLDIPEVNIQTLENPEDYLEEVAEALDTWAAPGGQKWRVLRQMRIGFFTFGKDIMHRDLDPTNWPTDLLQNPAVITVLEGQERDTRSDVTDNDVEKSFEEDPIPTVLDADSSQMKALIRAARGENLVIQGPPGTGKSQTITNLIAAALNDGKTVLFMAEKLAALEVVQSRMEKVGLGQYCLQLHSKRSGVREVHEQIRRRMNHRRNMSSHTGKKPQARVDNNIAVSHQKLSHSRLQLNNYCLVIGKVVPKLNCSVSDLIWKVDATRFRVESAIRERSDVGTNIALPYIIDRNAKSASKTLDDLPGTEFLELVKERLDVIRIHWNENVPERASAWRGFNPEQLNQEDVLKISEIIDRLVLRSRNWSNVLGKITDIPTIADLTIEQLKNIYPVIEIDAPNNLIPIIAHQLSMGRYAPEAYTAYVENIRQIRFHRPTIAGYIYDRFTISRDVAPIMDALSAAQEALTLPLMGNGSLRGTQELISFIDDFMARLVRRREIAQTIAKKYLFGIDVVTIADEERLIDTIDRLTSLPDELLFAFEEAHANTGAPYYLDVAKKRAAEYSQRREQLSTYYLVDDAPMPPDIYKLRKELVEARSSWSRWWPWGRLGKAVRLAKTFRRGRIDVLGDEFIENLSDLAKVAPEERAFCDDPRLKTILGKLFSGSSTDWALLTTCIEVSVTIRDWIRVEDTARRVIGSLASMATERKELVGLVGDYRREAEGAWDLLPQDLPALLGIRHDGISVEIERRLKCYREQLQSIAGSIEKLGCEPKLNYHEIVNHCRQALLLCDADQAIERAVSDPDFLGDVHKGIELTDLAAIETTVHWSHRIGTALEKLPILVRWVQSEDPAGRFERLKSAINDLIQCHNEYAAEIRALSRYGSCDEGGLFSEVPRNSHPSEMVEWFESARNATDVLIRWSQYLQGRRALREIGVDHLVDFAEVHKIPGERLCDLADATFYQQWLNHIRGLIPEIDRFNRVSQEKARQIFSSTDQSMPSLYRQSIDQKLFERTDDAPDGISTGRVQNFTEMGLIKHELNKQRRHIPFRELVSRASCSLQTLMPCWMMGPASVAQFLPQGKLIFDLLIMDEASQIRPEDALGSLARAKQIIVVGDSKQMPPTDAFTAIMSESPVDDDDTLPNEDMESILDHLEKYFNQERLRWHYRSQHESLILFSNERFYDSSLIIPPSVFETTEHLGVHHHFIPGAKYHDSINEKEAEAVVNQLANHIILNAQFNSNHQESVGVVAMNVRQRDLIEEMFDKRRASDGVLAAALESFKPEDPYFIKNLENVQGDERDVIIISFTYGPDTASGKLAQRFGPIGHDGGWRRLNVLFTRSRKRIHAFTSMKSTDIRVSDNDRRKGVASLQGYLEYLEKGRLSDWGEQTGRGPDSAFEESVARVITQLGFKPHFQVGVNGFRIDVGVVDPRSPGRYLCGIECDGAPYHSHPVARDRDRLREEILRARGWDIYRIWSTDWYRNRRTEVERLENYLRIRSEYSSKS